MIFRVSVTFLVLGTLVGASFAQVNVAASANGGVATQSSDYPGGGAAKAIDGDRNGDWGHASVSHTLFDAQAWWQSAFVTSSSIATVNVFNRTDGWGERINTFGVYLYLGATEVYSATNQTFTPTITGPSISGMSFATGGVVADRVRIQLTGSNWLQLAEVEAVTAVPEPTTMAVLTLGALGILKRRKRA